MTAVVVEDVAPERYREAGSHLPRNKRDEIAHRFMAEFGMTGAQAVKIAKAMLVEALDPDGAIEAADVERMAHMTRAELVRLMEELPLGLRPQRKTPARNWRVSS